MNFSPTSLNQRIETLDVLRGASLLGILFINILSFNYPMQGIDLKDLLGSSSDLHYEKILAIFVQGSFYPIFAFLFGYGLTMQYTKAETLGKSFYKMGSKRLAVLFFIGLIHALFIWYGDILMNYAIFGFLLFAVIKLRPVFLALIAGLIFGLYQVVMFLMMLLVELSSDKYDLKAYVDLKLVKNTVEAYGHGSWGEIFMQRLGDVATQYSPIMWMFGLVTIFPYILMGAAASKWRLIENRRQYKWLWIALFIIMLPLGLYLKDLRYDDSLAYLGSYFWGILGAPVLSVGYVAAIVLLSMVPYALKLLQPIANVGRMSLTTYLSQSIIQSIIFYNVGFGLFGQFSVKHLILIAIAIYVSQVVFSTIWLQFFKQGPVEALWKRITYGKSLKKKEDII